MLEKRTERGGQGRDLSRSVPAAISDRGCERELNEDRYAIVDSFAGTTWVVCDGMGGVVGGDLAAQLAVDAIKRVLENSEQGQAEDVLRTAIEEANRVIVLRRQNPAFSRMGTTVVATIEHDGRYDFVHVGDSRAYLIRGKSIDQLTHDHTYVQQLLDEGKITEDEVLSHPQGHVLTRCLGESPHVRIDSVTYWCWPVKAGEQNDTIMLCSDGLYALVEDSEIAEIVSSLSPQESCSRLTELAKERGGDDNITVIVIPVSGRLADERPLKPAISNRKKSRRKRNAPKRFFAKILLLMFVMFCVGLVAGFVNCVISLSNVY